MSEPGEPQADDAEAAGQRRLDRINEDLQKAVDHVTPEELETYWSALPPEVRELVSVDGEVSADLLSYIADSDEDCMELLRQNGCPETEVAEKAVVLEALQLAAEEKAARLRRNRVAKRGAQMALDLATQSKAQRQREAGDLLEGEKPTCTWLEKHSGAVLVRRRRRSTD